MGQAFREQGQKLLLFLSCLFPEQRADRVFNLQERRLEPIIKQAQGLGATRLKKLQNWRSRDGMAATSTTTVLFVFGQVLEKLEGLPTEPASFFFRFGILMILIFRLIHMSFKTITSAK